jgi:hypothetical protein
MNGQFIDKYLLKLEFRISKSALNIYKYFRNLNRGISGNAKHGSLISQINVRVCYDLFLLFHNNLVNQFSQNHMILYKIKVNVNFKIYQIYQL